LNAGQGGRTTGGAKRRRQDRSEKTGREKNQGWRSQKVLGRGFGGGESRTTNLKSRRGGEKTKKGFLGGGPKEVKSSPNPEHGSLRTGSGSQSRHAEKKKKMVSWGGCDRRQAKKKRRRIVMDDGRKNKRSLHKNHLSTPICSLNRRPGAKCWNKGKFRKKTLNNWLAQQIGERRQKDHSRREKSMLSGKRREIVGEKSAGRRRKEGKRGRTSRFAFSGS